jgi:hypothetical protein
MFCKKIGELLRASESFKEENVTPTATEKFALLPAFWHKMMPADRKVVMTVVQSHGFITLLHALRCFNLSAIVRNR